MSRGAPLLPPEVLEAAKQHAAERGWTWREPVDAELAPSPSGERIWSIRTNAYSVGMNIRVTIRESDHAILSSAFLKR